LRATCSTPGLGARPAAAAPGVALIAAIVMTHWQPRRHVGIIFSAVAIYGIAIIVFALSESFLLSMAALASLGMSDMVSVVIRMTLIQLHTPDDMRGRVSAVNSLFVTASNQLGEFRAGLMAAWLGAVPAVLIGGIGLMHLWSPSRRRTSSSTNSTAD
jgi:predicted MFS family arabinose efflux permease